MSRIPASRLLVFVFLATAVLAIDLSTKSIVFNDLGYPGADPQPTASGAHLRFDAPATREGESVPYLDGWVTFRLLTSFNRGALWGLGQEYTWLFATLSLAAVIGIPIWLFGFSAARSLWLTIALALIFGGTLGNLYDRIGLHGCRDGEGAPIAAVRDFLLFTFGTFHWPVFNCADMFLVTGASMLVIHSLLPVHAHAADTVPQPRTVAPVPSEGAVAASLPPQSNAR